MPIDVSSCPHRGDRALLDLQMDCPGLENSPKISIQELMVMLVLSLLAQ